MDENLAENLARECINIILDEAGKYSIMEDDHRDEIVEYFIKIYKIWVEHFLPKERFSCHVFLLRSICELLGYDQYVELFPRSRSKYKIKKRDKQWERVLEFLQLSE